MEAEKLEQILEVQSTALLSCISMLMLILSKTAQGDVKAMGPASKMIMQAKRVQVLLAETHSKEKYEGSVSNH